MSLPEMITQKTIPKSKSVTDEKLENTLYQQFDQPEPNLVCV